MVNEQQLFMFYYNYLHRQWLTDTYGNGCFFFPDDITARQRKFRDYARQTYAMKIYGINIEFEDPEKQEQFFNEAERAFTMHVLANANTDKLWTEIG